jgi:hypothetical protein
MSIPYRLARLAPTVSDVMHLTYAAKSLLVGDDVGHALIEYAAALASAKLGDSVTLNALNMDGSPVEAVFLLDTGAPVMAETIPSDLPEPENASVVEFMQLRTLELAPPRPAAIEDQVAAQLETPGDIHLD